MVNSGYGHQIQVYDILGVEELTIFNSIVSLLTLHKNPIVLPTILVELGERKDENPYETFRDWYKRLSVFSRLQYSRR